MLDFYRRPLAPAHETLFDALPGDPVALARVVPGLVLHQHIAPAYGETPSPKRQEEAHTRSVDDILACVLAHDGSALAQARSPAKRMIGNCRHVSLLLTAMLRRKGHAARARCGFAAYFEKGRYLDHWVAELWDGKRWVMIDAQLDEVQKKLFKIDFDPMDVPRDRFLVAGDAWALCRDGKSDPDKFGIMDMHGWWFIAGNIVRDLASLNGEAMLPWDVWEPMPQPGEAADFARFDKLAELSRDPDAHATEVRAQPRVPPVVFNAIRQRPEQVAQTR